MRFKNLISVLFAVVIVCIALPMTVSADTWDSSETDVVTGPIEYVIDDNSSGTITVTSGTLTVTGAATSSTNDLKVVLQGTSSLIWNANYIGSGKIEIEGSGSSVSISNSTITTTSSDPALFFDEWFGSVTIQNCTITSFHQSIVTYSKTTIENCNIRTTYTADPGQGSTIATVNAFNDLTIKDSRTIITSNLQANESCGINFDAVGKTLLIEGGAISGRDHGILLEAGNVTITDGNISSIADNVIAWHDNENEGVLTIEDGIIWSVNDDFSGIYVRYDSDMDLIMYGGNVSGYNAIYVDGWGGSWHPQINVSISGGTLTATDETGAALYYGGDGSVVISGGTLIGAQYGVDIICANATLNVSPATSKSVTIKGNTSAIVDSAITPNYSSVRYSLTSTDYNGSGAVTAYHSTGNPFTNSATYKYMYLISGYGVTVTGGTANGFSSTAAAPGDTVYIAPTTASGNAFIGWTAAGISLSDPTIGTQSFTMPFNDVVLTAAFEGITYNPGPSDLTYYSPGYAVPIVTPIYDTTKDDYILVIATLNKSGTVNSTETVEDMTEAHRKAVAESISKIYLKIPSAGKGISNSAMNAVYKAAGGTKLYITFGFYKLKDDGKTEEDIGTFFFPLSEKSGQILTGITFGTTAITNIENYISGKWNTGVLGSFETTHKGGWGESATVSMDIDRLGFAAADGENVYALIYDTKAKKFYQSKAKIKDGYVTFSTTRSGIVTIVTRSIK